MKSKLYNWVVVIIPAIMAYIMFMQVFSPDIKSGGAVFTLQNIVAFMWPTVWLIAGFRFIKLWERVDAQEKTIQDLTSAIASLQSGYKHGDVTLANELSIQKNDINALEIAFDDFQIVALVSNEFRALRAVNGDYSGIRYTDPETRDKNFRTNQILECNYILKKLIGLYPKVSIEENRNCIAKYFGISPEDF